MKPNVQYECLSEECRTIVIGVGKYMDGRSCPRCNGPITPKPFVQSESKKETEVVSAVYQCLCCGHSDRVRGMKEDYSEVKVCPKCSGAFIDVWKIAKYKQDKSFVSQQDPIVINVHFTLEGKPIARLLLNSPRGLI
jgi:uncharacterized CHY-type Zn-finger protein